MRRTQGSKISACKPNLAIIHAKLIPTAHFFTERQKIRTIPEKQFQRTRVLRKFLSQIRIWIF